MMKLHWGLIIGLSLFVGISGPAYSEIKHRDIEVVTKKVPIIIESTYDSELHNELTMNVFYRTDTQANFRSKAMSYLGSNEYQTTITPELSGSKTFEYFISISKGENEIDRYPKNGANTPVRAVVQGHRFFPVQLKTLLPKNPAIGVVSPFFVIRIDDSLQQINTKSIQVYLDGSNISNQANISASVITFPVSKRLDDGDHQVIVTYKTKNGTTDQFKYPFSVQVESPKLVKLDGRIYTNMSTYSSTQASSGVNLASNESKYAGSFTANTLYGPRVKASFLLDSNESETAQPLNRFNALLEDKKSQHKISIGTNTPVFSSMTHDSKRLEGIYGESDLFSFVGLDDLVTVKYFNGLTNRAIKADGDSIFSGTFAQKATGLFVNTRLFSFENGVSYVRYLDDLTSLSASERGSATAAENHVFGTRHRYTILEATQLSLDTAASVFYSDREAEVIDVSQLELPIEGEIKDQVLSYFPPRSSLVVGAAGAGKISMPIFFRRLWLNGFGNIASPGFTSLGESSVKKDNIGYGGSLTINLFQGSWILSPGFSRNQNNVLKSFDNTVYSDEVSINSMVTLQNIADFSISYLSNQRENQADDGSEIDESAKLKNSFNSISYSLGGIQSEFLGIRQQFSFQYSVSEFTDFIIAGNENSTNVWSVSSRAKRDNIKYFSKLSYSTADSKSGEANTVKTTGLSLNATVPITQDKWFIDLGTGLTLRHNNSPDDDFRQDNRSIDLNLGTQYRFGEWWGLENIRGNISSSFTIARDGLLPSDNSLNYSESRVRLGLSTNL